MLLRGDSKDPEYTGVPGGLPDDFINIVIALSLECCTRSQCCLPLCGQYQCANIYLGFLSSRCLASANHTLQVCVVPLARVATVTGQRPPVFSDHVRSKGGGTKGSIESLGGIP